MSRVAAILPCKGRPEQTLRNVKRLLATAGMGYGVDWRLITVVNGIDDADLMDALIAMGPKAALLGKYTYWEALAYATETTDAPLLCNLANDLIPGHNWLRRAVDAYDATFGTDGVGMIGFNGDSHETEHSCHFLISRSLLDLYGGWPVWYQHNFGDTELCQRAIADGLYAKAPYALLFHDHPYFGGQDDAVYAEGRASSDRDARLYEERRRAGWPQL